MTLDEAIAHCEEVAELNRTLKVFVYTPNGEIEQKREIDCIKCAEEHVQLAEWLKEYKRLLEMPKGDLISREALKKVLIEEYEAREHYSGEIMLKVIDNALTVERPQGDCENCDFRKFSEKFVDGVVEVMNKNGITSIEQLSEMLKGGAK